MRTLPLVIVVSLCTAAQAADTPQQTFNELFGAKVKEVTASRTSDDDVALAKQILQSAGQLKADEPLRVVMFNSVYDLGRAAPEGFDTALEAMKLLGEQFPAHAEAASEKSYQLVNTAYRTSRGEDRAKYGQMLVDIQSDKAFTQLEAGDYRAALASYRQALATARLIRSDSADNITARIEQSMELVGAERRKELLDKQADNPPVDAKVVEELVRICVAKFNKPAAAQDYAPLLDADTKQKLALVAKPIEELMPADCLALGQWYADFASAEKGLIKLTNLEHAETYLSRYFESVDPNAPKSVEALKAELVMKTVRAELDKFGDTAGSKSRWIDLTKPFIKLVDTKEIEAQGGASAIYKDGVFTLEGEFARLSAPVPDKNVIISVEIRKLDGQYITLGGRLTDDTALFVEMAYHDHIYINRFMQTTGRTELTDGVFKKAFDGQFHEFQLAILGDTILAFLDGKEILRIKDDKVAKAGKAGFAVKRARAEFRKPRMLVPSAKQVEELLAANEKR